MDYSIRFEHVDKSFGDTDVIKDLNLNIHKGERLILLGPSGCGKSTILRMISGLETLTRGNLYLNDVLANDIESGERGVSMVFQNYALFPHMTVGENITYGLRINKTDRAVIEERLSTVMKILSLDGLRDRLPRELSGGQRQRVALGRALVKRSDFLLLDEPLSNLDAQLRGQARKELVKIHEMFNQTFVYVTHDQIEAMTIGQRIALLHDGKIQMLDTPTHVYHRPTNIFVATFIGSPSMNILEVKRDGNRIVCGDQSFVLDPEWVAVLDRAKPEELKLGVRPENVQLAPESSENCLSLAIDYIEDYGNRVGLYFDLGSNEVISIMNENRFTKGQTCYWPIEQNKLHFFDGVTGKNLGYPESFDD